MKVPEQCGIAASKGNQIIGLIRRNITYKEKKLIIPLHKNPHLNFCIQTWTPYRIHIFIAVITRQNQIAHLHFCNLSQRVGR